jgi:hypothetical protein
MNWITFLLVSLLVGCSTSPLKRPEPSINVIEIEPDKLTALTKQNLIHLAHVYDLNPFLFNRKIYIHTKSAGHTFPELTLHTRFSESPHKLLAQLLHEEFHWWATSQPLKMTAAINELKVIYPKVPEPKITYAHLVICYLDYEALKFYLGEKTAKELITNMMKKNKIYPWVYSQVLNKNFALKRVIEKYQLLPPPLG